MTSRERVVAFLTLLTNDRCRVNLARRLGDDRVLFEFCRIWFDDIYEPGDRYMDGIKGDRDGTRIDRFEAAFSDDELASLRRFHAFLELRMEMVPQRLRAERRLPESDLWNNIVRDATYLLEEIEPDEARRRQLAAWFESLSAGESDLSFLSSG